MPSYHYHELQVLFAQEFECEFNTILVAGTDEPYYQPARGDDPAEIVFAHGFYASALHEIAHWCIAGAQRRQMFDYGYWYHPDGRDADQQRAFEQVEIKPQALEWLFSLAAGVRFQVSVDNLSGVEVDRQGFQARVWQQVEGYLEHGMPARAERFCKALAKFYQRPWPPQREPAMPVSVEYS
ncbi:elongation factor P hydroxylase [Pseudidiomarina taiwanensis]|uniref:Transporting ATPase n=1 Tax=Pseudidiomarina taiwanensis TaxID=337250 RepID=A0A432ZNQ8_9GAMM|nr:elongation factor P hydroxylase [Pseudidiomarina taiwanensis]RUO79530.1 transporting ATPase [Pseudidiomarina taiwanensis]